MSKIPPLTIDVQQLPHGQGLSLPTYATAAAAGLDLCAAIDQDLTLCPGERHLIPTGLVIALPSGYEAQIRPRSGLALKHGVTVLNAPGTIDADYRGEIGVLLINFGTVDFSIRRGERIAQMIIAPVITAELKAASILPETDRGADGFGSTGVSTSIKNKG